MITKKHYCGSKIPTPPHNFSNGPSLRSLQLGVLRDVTWYVLVIFNYMPVRSSYDHYRIGSSRKYNSFLLVKNYANLPVINSNHITKYIKKHIFNYTLYILSNLQLNFPVNFNLSRQTRDYNYSEQGMAITRESGSMMAQVSHRTETD